MPQSGASSRDHGLPPVINVIAVAGFAASLPTRALDPVLPHLAGDFAVNNVTAAWLSSGFAFTYSIFQPALGAAGDLFGKSRLMIGCLVLLGVANMLGALTTSFPLLLAARMLAGVAAGGVFPIALSLTSDLIATDKRQIAIGRTLAGAMAGNLLGALASGYIAKSLGWRGVLVVLGVLSIVASIAVAAGFRGAKLTNPPKTTLSVLKTGYRTIFTNPNAPATYSAVFIEGCCVFGLFPFIASFLVDMGETSPAIAGGVIAGFAVGGLFYSLTVSRLLPQFGTNGMMIAGAALVASQLVTVAFGLRWEVQMLNLVVMGWGFYMIHGCFQIFASELSVEARATALSLHSFFFFMGQTVGPVAYGFGLHHAGKMPTLFTSAAVMVALGLASARLLKPRPPADEAPGN